MGRSSLFPIMALLVACVIGPTAPGQSETMVFLRTGGDETCSGLGSLSGATLSLIDGREVDWGDIAEVRHHDAPASYKSGKALLRGGDYAKAAQQFEDARNESEPAWVKAFATFYLGEAYRYWGLTQEEKLPDAVRAYEEVLNNYPDTFVYPQAMFGLSDALRMQGKLSEARDALDGLQSHGHRGVALKGLSNARIARDEDRGSPTEATSYGTNISEITGADEDLRVLAQIELATIRFERGDSVKGDMESLTGGSRIQHLSGAHLLIGKELERQGQELGALYHFLRAKTFYPGNRQYYAEALYRAATLSQKLEGEGKFQPLDDHVVRSAVLIEELKQRCPGSRWIDELQ